MVLDLAMLVNAPRPVSRVFFYSFFYFFFCIWREKLGHLKMDRLGEAKWQA